MMFRKIARACREWLQRGLARQEDLDNMYSQVAGLLQIQNAMVGRPVIGPLREWAISPDAIAWILADLQKRESPLVVEFGAGQSTIILAAAIKSKESGGRLISVEHDQEYAVSLQSNLNAYGLSQVTDLKLLPLRDAKADANENGKFYDLSGMCDTSVDLALVDGPPHWCGKRARLGPLMWALEHLSPNGAVYVDDYDREAERSIIEEIKVRFCSMQINIEILKSEKGLARLTIGG
jgi:predicted O-methyltransferase YrrM